MNNSISKNNFITSMLPQAAKQRLFGVALGWIGVALFEAVAYIILAFSIVEHWQAQWVLLSALVAIFMTIIVTRAGYLTGVRLAGDLFADLGKSLTGAKLSWFSQEQRAQIGKMAGQAVPGFMSIPAHQFQTFLHAPCLPIFILIGMAFLAGWQVMLVALLLMLIAFFAQVLAQLSLMKADKNRHQTELETAAATIELVDHLELLQSAAGPEKTLERIEQRWLSQENVFKKINLSAAWATAIATCAGVFPIAGLAIYWLYFGQDNAALLLALIVLISRAAAPLAELATAGLGINDVIHSLRGFYQVTHAPVLSEAEVSELPHQYDFALDQVSYAPALKKLNVEIPFGARVNVRGKSGSGKSTLLELLMRFDDPDQGQIKLGGISLTHIQYQDLIQHIAYVSQEAIIFTGTLADNIRLGKSDASDAEIEEIARRCELGSVIERKPEGIHQSVGQQGSTLSGGERQRLAIARALIKKSPILIMDEATSALDEKTEQAVIHSILAMSQTLIFVSHRDTALWQATQNIDLGD
ncbi:ABC transporter ATP-binding protein [Acinetobacter gerneri]|uniref:ABC transporter ATP-binding protein n=1 Tax=Acinetobacter gerneri TaxID=202952 RepID=A0AAW8JLI5_9GAMM|nr:ABC transporter ATP-binding protein [Acinetobacter gerneri]MDQ9010540.1 ABC transporter ATP-binding protein [Acinetobacter gerneri]MDQ9014739.1 ABC transporter ATP-binding protein [Acinetobacter gerneri]MDQ9025923.1 ABC transporter ATP-binding protein [Acinetobacter gerneri]MDQ9053191.1 ABC transporter ATP-binding protein [Acinetobacter gerneri]MDQ9060822.1 ABC transporter ATP-binding protein [Acinetobacter gerneri]